MLGSCLDRFTFLGDLDGDHLGLGSHQEDSLNHLGDVLEIEQVVGFGGRRSKMLGDQFVNFAQGLDYGLQLFF